MKLDFFFFYTNVGYLLEIILRDLMFQLSILDLQKKRIIQHLVYHILLNVCILF